MRGGKIYGRGGGLTVSFRHSSDRQNRYDNNKSNGERQAYYERGAYFVRHGEMNQKEGTIGKEGRPTRGTGRPRVDSNDGDKEGETFNYAGVSDHGMHARIIDREGLKGKAYCEGRGLFKI